MKNQQRITLNELLSPSVPRGEDAEETLEAILCGEADALVIEGDNGPQIYTLEDANEPYRHLVERMYEAALILDRDGTVLYGNGRLAAMLGRDELTGQNFPSLVAREHRNRAEMLLESGSKSQTSAEVEIPATDGKMLALRVSAAPMEFDRRPCVALVITPLDDIAALKKSETALRESEKVLRLALDAGGMHAWEWNPETGVCKWTDEHYRLLGYEPGSVEPKYEYWAKRLIREDLPKTEALLEESLKTGCDYAAEYRVQGKNGEVRWLEGRGKPVFDARGKALCFYGVMTDITERKQAEQALRESEERARRLENTLTQGIVYRNREGRILRANPAAENILGRSAAELMNYTLADLESQCIREDGSLFPLEEQPILVALQTGETVSKVVLGEFNPRMNMYRWLIVDSVPLFRPGEDTPYEAYSIFSDITESMESHKALAEAKAEAERANLAKSKFLAAASHDLRQPAQTLVLLLSVLESQVVKNPQAAKTLDMMKTVLDGLSTLLSGMLDLSRLDAGVMIPKMTSFDVGNLVNRLVHEFTPNAMDKGLALRAFPRALHAWTDPDLLERTLRNLISNALRYTSKGGVLVGVRQRGDRIRIDVIDTGIGIPADKQTQIFDEFYQVDNPGRDNNQGLGLGLAIVSRLARLLDAKIQVASRPDRGSRFSLLLPFDRKALPKAQ
jgi:PAS domain S-box-containing protein